MLLDQINCISLVIFQILKVKRNKYLLILEKILSPVVINSFISSLKDCKILDINASNKISSIFYAKLWKIKKRNKKLKN